MNQREQRGPGFPTSSAPLAQRVCAGRGFEWTFLAGLVFVLAAGTAQGQGGFGGSQDGFGGSQGTSASDPNALVVGTENPDDLTAETENPQALTVGTRSLPGSTPTQALGSQGLDSEGNGSESPSALSVGTESLSDTPGGPGLYGSPSEQGRLPDLVPAAPRDIGEARAMLARAQSRLAVANTAVGNMNQRNYPTGEARLRLYDAKKSAQTEVTEAEGWVQKLDGSGGGFGSD